MMERVNEIKNVLNKKIKLVKISYVGIKADEKKVGVESVLQNLSKEISIPSSERFNFFDFGNARENIENGLDSRELKQIKFDRLDKFEIEFNKLKNILHEISVIKSIIDKKIVKGKYKTLSLVYRIELTNIMSHIEKIEKLKRKIDRDKFGEGMTVLIDAFKYKIRGELKRHRIEEGSEVEVFLEKSFKELQNVDRYINNINIKCKYIVDLSDEIMKDRLFINNLDNTELYDEEKNLIREYLRLKLRE